MLRTLSNNWWIFLVRGLLAIVFGVLALIWPTITLIVLVWIFGAYVFADGLFQIFSALTRKKDFDRWWLILLEGIFGIVMGVLTFVWPGITAFILLMLIVAWAFITGVLEIAAAIQLRKVLENEWLLAFSGVLSILLGAAMLVWPGASALALTWLVGIYAIIFGITLIALGLRLRRWKPENNQELNFA